jgi:hypothetical protein
LPTRTDDFPGKRGKGEEEGGERREERRGEERSHVVFSHMEGKIW